MEQSPETAQTETPMSTNHPRSAWVNLVAAVTLVAGGFILGNHYTVDISHPLHPMIVSTAQASTLDNSLFSQVQELMQDKYLRHNELDKNKMLYGAIEGMVASAGDPYTSFFDPTENKDVESQLSGTYEGIGAELGFKDKQIVVLSPIKDSPAIEAGVKAGDAILKIGDKDTSGMSLAQAVALIRGKAGSPVTLTILHEGADKSQTITLTRRQINVESVDVSFKHDPNSPQADTDVAYVKLSRFGDTTIDEWDKAVDQITSHGAKEMVLDLRNNPGGYFDAAIHVGSEFFKDGVIVGQKDAQGKVQNYQVDHAGRLTDMPVVVLINEGSASASEIVSGALHARHRAELIGENSFGKGSVQQVIDLAQGTSLHVTIAKWLTPDGNNIDKVGIKPDQTVKLTDDDFNAGRDPQLDAALKAASTSPTH